MKSHSKLSAQKSMGWVLRFSMALGVAAVIMTTTSGAVGAQNAQAPASTDSNPVSPSDKAWEAFSASTTLPAPPESWQGDEEPSLSEIEAFRKEYGEAALKSANLARDFIKSFPTETERVAQASDVEFNMLQLAVRLGVTKETDRLQKLEAGRLSDPSIPEEQRFEIRVNSMQRKVMEKESE